MDPQSRLINFNAGPASLPEPVLQQLAEAVRDYNGSGLSILEIPHRGRLFDAIMDESRQLVRDLCGLGHDYEVLWLPGGRLQFAMIPMNFLAKDRTAGYVDSGQWAAEAMSYAGHYGNVSALASSRGEGYHFYPSLPEEIPHDLSYVYLTSNNTIFGTQCAVLPRIKPPLVADMSSDILSMKRDYTRCALFYAVAQKNLGAAGVALVVIRKDMLPAICRDLPPMLDYAAHARAGSVLNTPPVFAIYTSLLMLRWISERGVETIEAENRRKAALLYDELERNTRFRPLVRKESRSLMNVVFKGISPAVEASFERLCGQKGITGIRGHRNAGGFRVSLYNSIPADAVRQLIACMEELEQTESKNT